ncbi:YceD family protein [Nitrosomonas sp.]|uniref:YceD family protein n=1 Tax=Nitrosomonas sp. TaxID=42353 RepID=UPI00260CEDEF|nr:YceD family protein [Nitrosomonas sp.]
MSVRFVITPLDFVRNAGVHYDKIPVFEFARLRDLLFDDDGVLVYQIRGYSDKNNKPCLHLEVKGEIHLKCQRCLDKLTHVVDLQAFFRLVKNEAELNQADDDDTIDAILATSDLDVFDLIEEEIILSLPISSCHPDNECKIHLPGSIESNIDDQSHSAHPFATLAKFKKTN